jgi:ABC-type sulfate transport system permease subunit
MSNHHRAPANPELEIELAALRSHEMHMRHIYGLRWGGLVLSALTILAGAVMVFMGLQGSFDWAIEAPHSIAAKLTNASPGIVFATAGIILGFVVVVQKPVDYTTGDGEDSISIVAPSKRRRRMMRIDG